MKGAKKPMAAVETTKIRNVCLLGHGGNGKTSVAEAMLYIAKGSDRLGKTQDGTTVCDYDAEEIKRKYSISTAIAPISPLCSFLHEIVHKSNAIADNNFSFITSLI